MSRKQAQLELDLRTWGGKRVGAGRPQVHRRCSEPHREREDFAPRAATHVTLRLVDGLPTLRCPGAYDAIHAAMTAVRARDDFRIVHASIQRNHLHLLNEADGKESLGKGVQALQISAAHHLKRHLLRDRSMMHKGSVFVDRDHVEIVDTPTQTRNALAYVLLNWRKHGEDRDVPWLLDPYASALAFDGWSDAPGRWTVPDRYRPLPTRAPRNWLLREGWRRAGAIAMTEVPSQAVRGRRRGRV